MSRLIENFSLSAFERGVYIFRKEAVQPNDLVRAALDATSLKMKSGRIELRLEEYLPLVHADRDSFNMVLVNFLENAWKYTGENKRIIVETRRSGDRVIFSVEDNGIGIARAEQSKIFKRFYQVDQKLARSAEDAASA